MLPLAFLLGTAAAAPHLALDVGLEVELPVSSGLQATLELPGRLRLGAVAGRLPGVLVFGASEVGSAQGLLDDEEAGFLGETLGDAVVLGGSVGWRPLAGAGLWLAGDLRRVRLQTSAAPELLVTALSVGPTELEGTDAEGMGLDLGTDPYDLTLRATLVGGSVGWDQVLAERVTLRVSVGALALRSGDSVVSPGADARAVGPEQQVAAQADEELDGLFARRFLTPTLGLGLAWHLGGGRG